MTEYSLATYVSFPASDLRAQQKGSPELSVDVVCAPASTT